MKRGLWVLLLGLAACVPDFVEAWEVAKPRHLAARLQIEGDTEARARPRVGESFSVEFVMMSPEKPQKQYDALLSVCLGFNLADGSLTCVAELPSDDIAITIDPYQGDDRLVARGFRVPSELSALPPPFEAIDRFGVFGAMCVDGKVERVPGTELGRDSPPSLFRCVSNDASTYKTPLPFSMTVYLDRGEPGQQNRHPSLACNPDEPAGICALGRPHDGETVPGPIVLQRPAQGAVPGERTIPWPAFPDGEALPWEGCARDARLIQVREGEADYHVFVRFDVSDRETYTRAIEVNGVLQMEERREELVLSHALTTLGGELSSYNSAIVPQDEDADAEVEFDYKPPKHTEKGDERVPEQGRLVRFYFALRDRRGGVDTTTRALCLVPSAD